MKDKNIKHVHNKVPLILLRVKAAFLDYLVILGWMVIVGTVGFIISLLTAGYPDYIGMFGPVGTQIIFFCILTLPVATYLYMTESGIHHSTLGKRKVGIFVVRLNGDLAPKKNILLRTFVKLLPWEIAHTFVWQLQYVFYHSGYSANVPIWIFIGLNIPIVLVIIYVAMITMRKDGRAPYDLIAGTHVTIRQT